MKMAIVPLDSIHISQFPSTATTATTSSTQTVSAKQVTKTLENMSLQSKGIETLQGQLKALEVKKDRVEVDRVIEM